MLCVYREQTRRLVEKYFSELHCTNHYVTTPEFKIGLNAKQLREPINLVLELRHTLTGARLESFTDCISVSVKSHLIN